MIKNFYEKITGINLLLWILAYIGTIILYTQLPPSTWAVRPLISDIALVMIGVILVAAFEKVRSD